MLQKEKQLSWLLCLYLYHKKNAFCMVDNLFIPSNDASSGERITLRQYVFNEIVNLESETGKLVVIDSMELAECKKMKKSMMSVLLLLEIFLRTKDEIADTAR
ncbi:hypothetical protein ACH5RR_036205 [Cinchona calisaya]|uniref:Uncharacterized protein n=1 Tax=Cinchona calisaya TaxID=153742 RepID=A0ABD2Y2I7_9GENT